VASVSTAGISTFTASDTKPAFSSLPPDMPPACNNISSPSQLSHISPLPQSLYFRLLNTSHSFYLQFLLTFHFPFLSYLSTIYFRHLILITYIPPQFQCLHSNFLPVLSAQPNNCRPSSPVLKNYVPHYSARAFSQYFSKTFCTLPAVSFFVTFQTFL
jgi:hypothetical protein